MYWSSWTGGYGKSTQNRQLINLEPHHSYLLERYWIRLITSRIWSLKPTRLSVLFCQSWRLKINRTQEAWKAFLREEGQWGPFGKSCLRRKGEQLSQGGWDPLEVCRFLSSPSHPHIVLVQVSGNHFKQASWSMIAMVIFQEERVMQSLSQFHNRVKWLGWNLGIRRKVGNHVNVILKDKPERIDELDISGWLPL